MASQASHSAKIIDGTELAKYVFGFRVPVQCTQNAIGRYVKMLRNKSKLPNLNTLVSNLGLLLCKLESVQTPRHTFA